MNAVIFLIGTIVVGVIFAVGVNAAINLIFTRSPSKRKRK